MNDTCVNGNGSVKLTNSEKTQNDTLSLNSSGPIKPASLKSQVLATPVGSVADPDPHYVLWDAGSGSNSKADPHPSQYAAAVEVQNGAREGRRRSQ
jgi:hypothetical protein